MCKELINIKNIKNDKGQSLVEFAILLPILLLILMGILEFGIMFNSYLAVNNASREGARLGIVGGSDTEIQNLIISTSPSLKSENLAVSVTPLQGSRNSGDTLTVKVTYNYHVIVPLISAIISNAVVLDAETSMRVE